ncbi:putative amino acid transporter [Tripterygium wilfordii]|uniref:Putative amino acid transporter n=1 Tax=Tripterygium wilfordii TaxID=458696 RepID=A0A7J7CR49_TRIWF|nr:amino acid transporter AVT6C-like [Tripterygium wilfordii]KAF5736524.1 putative amino acid transporter [Tripterygium wilfordii]
MREEENKADLVAPLVSSDLQSLEDDGIKGRSASVHSAVFNISTTMIGAGIMSIPATMKVLGVIPGFALIVIVAYFVEATAEFMLKYTEIGKCTTYAGLMDESFGKLGAVAVQVCAIVTQFGCLIVYLIIIGDVLCGNQSGETLHLGVLQEWFGNQWWTSRPFALIFIVLFIILPLVLLKHVDSLRYSSALSILLAVMFVCISLGMAISSMLQGKTHKIRLFPDFGSQHSILAYFTTIPIFVTGLGFHVNVHLIRAGLGKPTHMSSAVRIALLICVLIYFAIGFSGYLLFGDSIMADILVNFDQNNDSKIAGILNDVVRLSYAIHLVLVFPVINFTLRANIDELVFSRRTASLGGENTRFVFLTCVLLVLSYLMAVIIPNIWYFFQFIGSTTIVCTSFIFPAAIVLRDVHGISSTKDMVMGIMVIVLAVGTSSLAIYTNSNS